MYNKLTDRFMWQILGFILNYATPFWSVCLNTVPRRPHLGLYTVHGDRVNARGDHGRHVGLIA